MVFTDGQLLTAAALNEPLNLLTLCPTVATFSALTAVSPDGFYLVSADETKGGVTTIYALTTTGTQWIASVQDS